MMRAIVINSYGAPEVLQPTDLPIPVPGHGELLVRVRAAAVNPADTKWRAGMFASFAPVSFPHVLGYDIAGEVVAGDGFTPGVRVFGMLDPFLKGGYAQHAVIPTAHTATIPDALDFATAAAIPTAGLTGWQMAGQVAPRPGQIVLLTGAVGAVGRFALCALKTAGAYVVAGVRERQREEAMQLGADTVIALDDADGPDIAFDHVIDTVGGAAVARLCRHLRPGGTLLTAATTPIPAEGLATAPVFFAVRPDGQQCAQLADLVASGRVPVPIARTLALDEAELAHRLVEQGRTGGKIILTP